MTFGQSVAGGAPIALDARQADVFLATLVLTLRAPPFRLTPGELVSLGR